jgi:hypothetical protein
VVSWAIQRGTLAFLSRLRAVSQALSGRLLWLRAGVVVGQFQTSFSGVLALAIETVPDVALAAARYDDFGKVDPRLANELRLLVVVEDGDFEVVVVGRVVYGEAQFLVPVGRCQQNARESRL